MFRPTKFSLLILACIIMKISVHWHQVEVFFSLLRGVLGRGLGGGATGGKQK